MKKFMLKPGFEFIFALSLIVILGLPPMLMAQPTKDIDIQIINGDTTVNGKNISSLSAADRKIALRDIRNINSAPAIGDTGHRVFMFKRDTLHNQSGHIQFRRRGPANGGRPPMITEDFVTKDSSGNIITMRGNKRRDMGMGELNPNGRFRNPGPRFERRNSQNFDFVNTDNDGISTHVMFHISDVTNDDLKKIPHVEGGKFEITDLNLVPEFTTGKTLLLFNLPAKTMAEVKFIDSEGKILWTEKGTGGTFSKTFVMGLNGIYYLQITQGHNIAIKRIMKEG